jgi:immunity protein 35 of polymorphic toxin system
MIKLSDARAIAHEHVESLARAWSIELALDDGATRDESWCWLFFYNSRVFLESGSPSDALAGNGPLAVEKRSGQLHELVAARPIAHQLGDFGRRRGEDTTLPHLDASAVLVVMALIFVAGGGLLPTAQASAAVTTLATYS